MAKDILQASGILAFLCPLCISLTDHFFKTYITIFILIIAVSREEYCSVCGQKPHPNKDEIWVINMS